MERSVILFSSKLFPQSIILLNGTKNPFCVQTRFCLFHRSIGGKQKCPRIDLIACGLVPYVCFLLSSLVLAYIIESSNK